MVYCRYDIYDSSSFYLAFQEENVPIVRKALHAVGIYFIKY